MRWRSARSTWPVRVDQLGSAPGEQSMGLFSSRSICRKPFSARWSLDQAEEIGRDGVERSGRVLPQMPGQVQPVFKTTSRASG